MYQNFKLLVFFSLEKTGLKIIIQKKKFMLHMEGQLYMSWFLIFLSDNVRCISYLWYKRHFLFENVIWFAFSYFKLHSERKKTDILLHLCSDNYLYVFVRRILMKSSGNVCSATKKKWSDFVGDPKGVTFNYFICFHLCASNQSLNH